MALLQVMYPIFQGDFVFTAFHNHLYRSHRNIKKHHLQVFYVKRVNLHQNLLFMDDLRLYGKTERELQLLVCTVRIASYDIRMRFGMRKCNIVITNKGGWSKIETD